METLNNKQNTDMNTDQIFNSIYKSHYSKVLNHISFKLRNIEDAEDITANVFMKIYQNYALYDKNKANITTWIFNIARNAMIDHLRKTKNDTNKKLFGDMVDEDGNAFFIVPDYVTPQTIVENQELRLCIDNAINRLSGLYKEIAKLYFIQQLTNDEIAKKLNIPLGSVKGDISRIREMLQSKLKR